MEEQSILIGVRMPPRLVKKIDWLAEQTGRTRSQIVRLLAERATLAAIDIQVAGVVAPAPRQAWREKCEAEKRIEENVAWQMKEGEEAERIRREEEQAWAEHEREKKQDRREA